MSDINHLKAKGLYYKAGQLAFTLGHDDNYGCHFGMRSELEYARASYKRGYHDAKHGPSIIAVSLDDGPGALHNTFLQIFGE